MPNTYITIPFKELDTAKALGTRWDNDATRRVELDQDRSLGFTLKLVAGCGLPRLCLMRGCMTVALWLMLL